MKYSVIITPDAENELRIAYRFIRKSAPRAAGAWIKGARRTVKSLAQHPERGHIAPESSSFHEPIREVIYGKGNRGTYRVLYTVIDRSVFVLHVRHGSMLPLGHDQEEE